MRKPSASNPSKHTIVQLSPTQTAEWQAKVAPVIAEWAKAQPDGEKVLETYRKLLVQVKAGASPTAP
jgi:hypothetical protein